MKIKDTQTIKDCQKVFNCHNKDKGNSWKKCAIDFLRDKLDEEYQEFEQAYHRDYDEEHQYEELLDVINVAVMLAERLRI